MVFQQLASSQAGMVSTEQPKSLRSSTLLQIGATTTYLSKTALDVLVFLLLGLGAGTTVFLMSKDRQTENFPWASACEN